MSGNTTGKIFRLTTFGESHGKSTGGLVDGCPPGIILDENFIRDELVRRKTGGGFWSSDRIEPDKVEFHSGIFEGKTTGTPIAFFIRNKNVDSKNYEEIKDIYRPSHADYTYEKKYGIRDYRGGGRASARETVARVVGGAIAKLILKRENITVTGFVSQIGKIKLNEPVDKINMSKIQESPLLCPSDKTSEKMLDYLKEVSEEGDSVGGIVTCIIKGVMPGLGEPVFNKLDADLSGAIMSINAAKAIEIGNGIEAAAGTGSVFNDPFILENDQIKTASNNSGGIQGGISNGMDIFFRVFFKPVPTIGRYQTTVDKKGSTIQFKGKGRHDICLVPRAVTVVEAMASIVIADYYLRYKAIR